MKYSGETEKEFQKRFEEAKLRGECLFSDDSNREIILDIIDDYIDIYNASLGTNK